MKPISPAPRLSSEEPTPDLQIILEVRRGDLKAFEVLMRRYNRLVFRTVRSITRSDAEAEDVTQEAWIAAYRNLAQFEGRAAFSTWLTRIAIRLAAARTRTPFRFETLDDLDRMDMERESDTPAAALERRQTASMLERALDELPADYRLVLVLRDVEQLSTSETAESLGVTEENVRVRLHRSRAALRERLQANLEGNMEDVFAFDGQRCDRMVHAVMSRLRRGRGLGGVPGNSWIISIT
jgi:RNA polymerase sigma-70 factor (ECF subfamily)